MPQRINDLFFNNEGVAQGIVPFFDAINPQPPSVQQRLLFQDPLIDRLRNRLIQDELFNQLNVPVDNVIADPNSILPQQPVSNVLQPGEQQIFVNPNFKPTPQAPIELIEDRNKAIRSLDAQGRIPLLEPDQTGAFRPTLEMQPLGDISPAGLNQPLNPTLPDAGLQTLPDQLMQRSDIPGGFRNRLTRGLLGFGGQDPLMFDKFALQAPQLRAQNQRAQAALAQLGLQQQQGSNLGRFLGFDGSLPSSAAGVATQRERAASQQKQFSQEQKIKEDARKRDNKAFSQFIQKLTGREDIPEDLGFSSSQITSAMSQFGQTFRQEEKGKQKLEQQDELFKLKEELEEVKNTLRKDLEGSKQGNRIKVLEKKLDNAIKKLEKQAQLGIGVGRKNKGASEAVLDSIMEQLLEE